MRYQKRYVIVKVGPGQKEIYWISEPERKARFDVRACDWLMLDDMPFASFFLLIEKKEYFRVRQKAAEEEVPSTSAQ